jgi:hypothetical protein
MKRSLDELERTVIQRPSRADFGRSLGPQWNRAARPSRDMLGHTSGSWGCQKAVIRVRLLDMPTPAHVSSSSSTFASLRSAVSKPSVNQA